MANTRTFDLPSGHRLHLHGLTQYLTYGGLIEGLPTTKRNKKKLERLIARYRDAPYPGKPYLIRPKETPIQRNPQNTRRYPFGTPSALPPVTCIARLESCPNKREYDLSGLVVIWFQGEFAFPIDSEVEAELLGIDWKMHASDMHC